jgi:hypothetical protein
MMACCFPGASSPMPLLHYTSHCMGPCAAGPLCPYNSKIAKGSFAIAVRAGGAGALQAGAAQGNLTAFCSPECFVESCKSVASEDAASLLPWKYSTVFTWQRQPAMGCCAPPPATAETVVCAGCQGSGFKVASARRSDTASTRQFLFILLLRPTWV